MSQHAVSSSAPDWGRSFAIFQPRNLCSWLFIWWLVLGAIATFRWFRPNIDGVGTATGWGVALFALYAIPWIWFLRRKDRWTPIPAKLLVYGSLWGGLTATFHIAIVANGALLNIYAKAFSPGFAADWGAGLAAPFSEETGKGIGILLLLFIAPRIIRTPFDGFIVGAFVGLGFQIVEDVLYAIQYSIQTFGADQFEAARYIFIARALSGFFSHALFSAIWGAGLVYLIGTAKTPSDKVRGIGLILLAMVAHGVWDSMAALAGVAGLNLLVVMGLVVILEAIAITLVLRATSRSERTWIRELMTPEVERGTVSEAELKALSGTRKDRKRFLHATGDHHHRRLASHVLEAADDLAEALARTGGANTPETDFIRSEVTRVRGSAA